MISFRKDAHIYLYFFVSLCYGQISPGDLTQAHSNLEGMSNCTQCHDLGEKVSNIKCLECHKEIKSLLNNNSGFHASSKVVNKDCFECHSEHHGREFEMIRFDKNNFNHLLTGYKLEGKHESTDCNECHKPANIENNKIKNRKNTFLGLDQKCLSCHDNYHQNTLSTECLSCHTMEGFTPALKFDHNTADFTLKGEHANVDCAECHKTINRNGEKFQEFSDIPFANCNSCHEDQHQNKLLTQCAQCHNETSFLSFSGKEQFNHNVTEFELKGSHKKINCFSCHAKTTNLMALFQDKSDTEEDNCIECHKDQHEDKYGGNCAKCHNENSFFSFNNMDFFDHTVTDYSLEGKHLEVDCKKCHTERFSAPIDFMACNNCHLDYHEGEFIKNEIPPDCKECHSLKNGFDYSLYTIQQHQETEFPLEGAHNATPCFSCHISEEDNKWSFKDLGVNCVDCHIDIHEGFISESYYPEKTCTSCHINESWNLVNFNHDLTDWPLTGKHKDVDCNKCHFKISENKEVISQLFTNLETNCTSCHENIHEDLFALNGVTDCDRCHVTNSWFPEKLDHNNTAFPLEGQHAEINCSACHEVKNDTGQITVVYKLNKLACTDCHQ